MLRYFLSWYSRFQFRYSALARISSSESLGYSIKKSSKSFKSLLSGPFLTWDALKSLIKRASDKVFFAILRFGETRKLIFLFFLFFFFGC